MKVLHLVFENFQDVAGLLSRSHHFYGDESELVTMARSQLGFPNGVLLNYPLLNSPLAKIIRRLSGRDNVNVPERELKLNVKGGNPALRFYFKARDFLWQYKLHKAWRCHDLGGFDIYHFDGDMPFIYGDRILKKLKGKRIVTHFFGSELRKWGMNPYLRKYAQLRFTSEVDHLKIDPSLIFVPIPFEVDRIAPRGGENATLVVGHSPTRRTAKGTDDIIRAVNQVKGKINFEFRLIEGVKHNQCMELKAGCDIGIDQVGNYAGTAYGRSGLEFLALGIPTITEIPDEYEPLLPGHPFVKATRDTLEEILYHLLRDTDLRRRKKTEGITWVRDFVNPRRVMAKIYGEYRKKGWL
jgi:hypothetical protein